MEKYEVGDFVMFRKYHSQWGHADGDYYYGMITGTLEHNYQGYKWATRYNICCSDGKRVTIKQNKIIVLAKSKKEN